MYIKLLRPELFYWLVRGAADMKSGENENKIKSFYFSILSAADMKSAKKWKKIKFFIFIFIPTADIFRQEFCFIFIFFPTADKFRQEFFFFLLLHKFETSSGRIISNDRIGR